MNNKQLLTGLTLALLINPTVYAANEAQDWKTLMAQYTQTKNNQFDAQDNLQAFEKYLRDHPDNALAEIYTASSHCLVARDAWMPWSKLNAVNVCIDQMEVAVAHAEIQYSQYSPERLSSYLSAGLTTAALPDRFQQMQSAVEILTKAKQHPAFSHLPNNLQQDVLAILASDKGYK